eukprot:TRINITY_DN5584_c0_g1_i1.p1 TRINITY_DN5584_c0_g1~~TRINITY_DN5584_c0_g1_i1.p1  ORF type:complete len:417 (-),score=93.46 TRINITY_DN5584_c0_g1_i1:230-1480(-)
MLSMLSFAAVLAACLGLLVGRAECQERQMKESDIFLGGSAFSDNETENHGILFRWLDDIMWTDIWDSAKHRQVAFSQLQQLADLSEMLPSLSFAVGQAYYSYFWFKDNGPDLDVDVGAKTAHLYELSLKHSGCGDLTMGVGSFLKNACHERWLHLIMINAEVGTELAERRSDPGRASALLQKADSLFKELLPYPYFSFRQWSTVYDINSNSHVFPEGYQQRPIWPNSAIPLAAWFEENYDAFREDLDRILDNNLFDDLYFMGQVSMTQFSGKRESWAPLNLIHNGALAPHACQVAKRSCELLQSRPEIARCNAKDVGAAFARLLPGMGIKPHFWTAPPRLGLHLGLKTPPGATMWVGDKTVNWEQGKAVVFDDTYIHTVKHRGTEARYLLIAWFCHPCDPIHAEVPPQDPEGYCPR